MNESTRLRTIQNRFKDPELTIAAGFLAIGGGVYAIETFLSPTLLLDGGDPAVLAAVFGIIGLFYLVVLVVAQVAKTR